MKKNLGFQQIRVILNSGISKYFFVLYFFLWTNYIGLWFYLYHTVDLVMFACFNFREFVIL